MINSIIARENEKSSIEKLAAQRQVYSKAKTVFHVQTFISTLSIVLLSFSQLLFQKVDFNLIIATWSLIVLFFDFFLEKYISDLKEVAAKIQELFDTYVLQIDWNNILCSEKIEYSEVCRYYEQHKKSHDLSNLTNWYEVEIATVPESIGKLVCQKTNCNYDITIRKKYKGVVLWISIVAILLLLIIAIFSEITLAKLVLTVLLPSAPIIQWAYKNISNNNDSITNLKQLNTLLNETWNSVKAGNMVDASTIRQIQDGIYLNRKSNPLIPDFVYDRLRDKLESQTRYSVAELIGELRP